MTPKSQNVADGFAVISSVATISAWWENIEFALRVVATLVAITAGVITIYQRLKKKRRQPDDYEV